MSNIHVCDLLRTLASFPVLYFFQSIWFKWGILIIQSVSRHQKRQPIWFQRVEKHFDFNLSFKFWIIKFFFQIKQWYFFALYCALKYVWVIVEMLRWVLRKRRKSRSRVHQTSKWNIKWKNGMGKSESEGRSLFREIKS